MDYENKQSQTLHDAIENLDETNLGPDDFERILKGNSPEAMALRRERKAVRYRLSRIQTMVLGGCDAQDDDGLKEKFEGLPMFGGWRFYKQTWDVSLDDPYTIVHKDFSEQEEWENVVRAKFPMIKPNGSIEYPDIKVKEKIESLTEG